MAANIEFAFIKLTKNVIFSVNCRAQII